MLDIGLPVGAAGFMPSFVTNAAESAVQHAIDGGGLTLVLASQAAAIRRGALRILLAEHERPPSPIQIVYPTQRLLSAKVRAFIDMAVAETRWSFTELGWRDSSPAKKPRS